MAMLCPLLVSFFAWLVEMLNNKGKEKSEQTHIARSCMQVFLIIDLIVVGLWRLYVAFSYEGVGMETRPLSQREIADFAQKGIKDISKGTWAEVYLDSGKIARIFRSEEGQDFSWGRFRLAELSLLDPNDFSFYPTGVKGLEELPETIDIDGNLCLVNAFFTFKPKDNQPITTYQPEDYYLSYCYVVNQAVQTPQGKLNLGPTHFYDMRRNDDELLTFAIRTLNSAAAYSADGEFDRRNMLILPQFKGEITLVSVYTDKDSRLIGMDGYISVYPEATKIGQCEYEAFQRVSLTDFTPTTAHWHFEGENIPNHCKMQVLPYRLNIKS
ncbi:hypothetical protein HYE66_05135 [Aggregatibacter actinomycetemcomitans]|nr:hypothetical protein [Aggregatibacter actinomycetemcomitans]